MKEEGPALVRTSEYAFGAGWLEDDERKFYSPAAERNKQPILEVLELYLSNEQSGGTVLEVASGSGQHVSYFAARFPQLQFQPSEYPGFPCPGPAQKPQEIHEILGSILAYSEGLSNILPPIQLDVMYEKWGTWEASTNALAAIICTNLVHIAPWDVAVGLFEGAGKTLQNGGFLFLYGPFKFCPGEAHPESNAIFDKKLKELDPNFGLRNVEDLDVLGKSNGLIRRHTYEMPANNHMLLYEKVMQT